MGEIFEPEFEDVESGGELEGYAIFEVNGAGFTKRIIAFDFSLQVCQAQYLTPIDLLSCQVQLGEHQLGNKLGVEVSVVLGNC